MQSASLSASSMRSEATNPGAVTRSPSPCAAISAISAACSGPAPKKTARNCGIRLAAAATPASPSSARFSGIIRPAKTTSGPTGATSGASSEPPYSPSSTVTLPRSPSPRRRFACSREKQNARCGVRAHRSCTRYPIGPPIGPRYCRQ